MKNFLLFFIFNMALGPSGLALAHEIWFTPDAERMPIKPPLFMMWNQANAALVLIVVFVLLAAFFIHFAIRPMKWARRLRSRLAAYSSWVPQILRVTTGILLFTASFSRFLFAPDLQTIAFPQSAERVLLAFQLFTGLGLMLGILPRFMSLLGITLFAFTLFLFPLTSTLGYVFFGGIFIYLFIIGDPALPKVKSAGRINFLPNLFVALELKKAAPYAMAVLRMLLGFSLMWVGFFYKIFDPTHAFAFLQLHPINFMPAIGFADFGNDMFVLASGVIEVLVGLLILLGLLPRLIGAVLIILFTFTLALFGIYELLGHLPLYGAAFALLTLGGGEKWSAGTLVPTPGTSAASALINFRRRSRNLISERSNLH